MDAFFLWQLGQPSARASKRRGLQIEFGPEVDVSRKMSGGEDS